MVSKGSIFQTDISNIKGLSVWSLPLPQHTTSKNENFNNLI